MAIAASDDKCGTVREIWLNAYKAKSLSAQCLKSDVVAAASHAGAASGGVSFWVSDLHDTSAPTTRPRHRQVPKFTYYVLRSLEFH